MRLAALRCAVIVRTQHALALHAASFAAKRQRDQIAGGTIATNNTFAPAIRGLMTPSGGGYLERFE